MAARTSPTERQRRLGAELRKMRASAGLSAEFVAGLLGVDRGRVSHIELGVRTISPERVRTLACNCECSNAAFVDALADMARPAGKQWWDRYRGALPQGLLDIAELEAHSPRMRALFLMHMPGLLQTSDYAMAVFQQSVPPLAADELALRLAQRMERQKLLYGPEPPAYLALLHEAALRMQFGGRRVAADQFEHLLETSERENITLRIVPFSAGGFPGAMQTVLYAEGAVRQLDTVQVDSAHGPEFLGADAQLAKYRALLDLIESISLPPEESCDVIRAFAREL